MHSSVIAIRQAVLELAFDSVGAIVRSDLEKGVTPFEVIEYGIIPGLDAVGEKYEKGEYFLGELIMAGQTAHEAVRVLESELVSTQFEHKGKVILATVQGDLHDIGKNIVGMLLAAYGFEVIDLGVNVPPEKIIQTAKKTGARLIGLSALLSTMVGNLAEVIRLANRSGLTGSVKIVIGGACTSERLRKEIGADAYAEDAVHGVQVFSRLL